MLQEPAQKVNWKKILVTVVITAVLIGLFAAVMYWYVASKTPAETPSLTKSPVATPSAETATPSSETEKSEPDETKGWRTFSAAGFSFRYPSGWEKVGDLDNRGKPEAVSGEIWERVISFQKMSGRDVGGVININVANNPSSAAVGDYVSAKLDSFFIGKEVQDTSDLEIDDRETLKLIYPASPQAYSLVSYVVAGGEKIYEFEYTVVTGLDGAVPTSEYETIFSTIEIP